MRRFIDAEYDVIKIEYDETTEKIVYRSGIKGYSSVGMEELLNYETGKSVIY